MNVLKENAQVERESTEKTKLSKYAYLLEAINIFSETLSIEQIFFATEEVFKSTFGSMPGIYRVERNQFQLVSQGKELENSPQVVPLTEALKKFALLSANLMKGEQIEKFFPNAFDEATKPDYAVPLITNGKFLGIIFLNLGEQQKSNFNIQIMDYLMRLIQISLEKYEKFLLESSLDEASRSRHFNLKSLNSMSHELFAQLDLEILFNLAIDAFLEITMAGRISFLSYDEKSEEFRTASKKSAVEDSAMLDDIGMRKKYEGSPDAYKNILDLQDGMDKFYFESLFECVAGCGYTEYYRYAVLIFDKGVILGFLLISESVNGSNMNESLVDVLDILSTNTFLAIKNAKLFTEVKEKNEIIEKKLNNLLRLNTLMDNINTADDSKTMLELIVQTLEISFDVEMVFCAMYAPDTQMFTIKSTANMEDLLQKTFVPNENWSRIMTGDSFVTTDVDAIFDYFEQELIFPYSFESKGILIKPMCYGVDGQKFVGVTCVFAHKKVDLSDYELNLYLDSIINHTTPMLWNLSVIEKLSNNDKG